MAYTQIFPILSSPDLDRLVAFYRTALDAVVSYRFPAEGEAGYVALDLAGGHLGIGREPAAPPATDPQRVALWIYTEDCDAAACRVRAAGGAVLDEPAEAPWGERVAKVADPDGNVLHLGQPPADQ